MSLKDIDYLSPKISLFYYGRRRHSAIFGGILTLIMIIVCFLYIIYLFSEVYLHTSSTIQYYRHFFTEPYIYLFNNTKGIFHYFQIYNPKNNSHLSSFDSKYIRVFMSQIQEEYKTNPELLSNTEHWVYDNCREGIDNKYISAELFKNISFKNGLCLRYYYNINDKNYYPIEDNINFKYPNITSSGVNIDYSISTIIEKCNNDSVLTKLFGTCGNKIEIENYFTQNYGINFNILTSEISPSDYGNQIYNFIYGISYPLKRKKIIENNLIISPLKIDINGGVFFPTRKQNQTYSFYDNYIFAEERNENSGIVSIYKFCLTQSGYVFKSTYLTIYDSFPNIGGIIQLIYYIFFGINFILNRYTIIDDTKKLFFTLHNDEIVNGGIQIKKFTSIVNNLRKNFIKKTNKNINFTKNPSKLKNKFTNNASDSFFQKNFENDNNKSLSIFPFIFDKDVNLNKSKQIVNINIPEKKLIFGNSDIIIEKTKSKTFKDKILKDDLINSNNELKLEKKSEKEKNEKDKNEMIVDSEKSSNNSDNNNSIKNNLDINLNLQKKEIIKIRKNNHKIKNKLPFHRSSPNGFVDSDILFFKILLQKYFDYKKKQFIYEPVTIDQVDTYFKFSKYLASILCYKKPRHYYRTLTKFRKKLLSEEHFFRTHNFLYLFEKCFDIQESQKIDIIELYKNL